ncbi:Putative Xaa-pro dipeptidase [Penicillium brasilianum]|uniref:Putative Xaa-pro dipeptidase n=1 Tax=Penicillium brasilianum TaxID=104259 RepID=A0A0F7VHH6_PENBI|nr:Putative Xaa-pro dipeptidase [Penicillium brasilianum]
MSKQLPSTQRDVEALSLDLECSKGSQFNLRKLAQFVTTLGLLVTGYQYLWHPRAHSTDVRTETSFPEAISKEHRLEDFQQCAIENLLQTGLPFLQKASPITTSEFQERRDRLAQALVAEDVDGFVVEPGYTFKYYGNVSQPEWEVWEPEERPFLMIVRPTLDQTTGQVKANTTFLCPSFEAERARLLGMPFTEDLQIVPWEEHWDPYNTLQQSEVFLGVSRVPRLMVDEEMRDFIQRGLGSAGFDVTGLRGRVEEVRQIKSTSEVEILRAVNTGTVEAVRQMRRCLYPGLTENEIATVLDNTLRAAGMEPFFDIVLFDENASNPHGGTDGEKLLEAETFVLIDVGAHLYGYSSDICRTFFPPFLEQPSKDAPLSPNLNEKLKVWDVVFEAQTQSIHQMRENLTAASVDVAARQVITEAGYGVTFTHRVGHGIGIKAHESPYLNKGNRGTLLKTGMTFTSEPGIYLVDKFGVRHEDILLVQGNEEPQLLTGTRAQGPWEP